MPLPIHADTASVTSTMAPGAARILVVEDQDDVRRMLVTALEIDGHIVDEADSAARGLTRLHQREYDLVLSDYAMPGGTGTWMLDEAKRLGLMNHAVALIITAHPDVRDLADVEVISKPLDLDYFLEEVRRLLVTHRPGSRPAGETIVLSSGDTARGGGEPASRIELVLYVSSDSPVSIVAQQNIERLLSRYDPAHVTLTVCDLASEPLAGDADRIAFTPTLVKKFPEPRMWFVGNLRDPEILVDLLRVSGVVAT